MRIFFVLLAFLGNAVAQAPNTCPTAPKSLLCHFGLPNTCIDDTKCRTGTLCCSDGCRRRCRDPSNNKNSGGAGTGTPHPGTCPSQLSPPAGPCVSDSDECMFDWDCDGSTKKCCSNNCFKECVDPGLAIASIRDRCPAPKEFPRCHFGFKNQCSNHSQCSYIKDGLCCFDGCRRRCATSNGFPSRLQTDRPGRCPVTPVPEFCVSDYDECEFDGDCYPGKKCCSNTCFTRCLDPLDLPGANTSVGGVPPAAGSISLIGNATQGEVKGECPATDTTNRCHIGLAHTCNFDAECPNGSYCCFDGCRRKCLDPNKESAGAQGEDKKGACPPLLPPEVCVSDVDECFIDWDCVGDRKCCSNGCYRVCASPSLVPAQGPAAGGLILSSVKCPEPVHHNCARLKHLCDDSNECLTGNHCCFDGCRRRCVSTSGTSDTCPKPAENLICLIGLRNTCFDDASCRQGTLCCNDGCRKRCRDPSLFSRGATEGKPRPGTCPSLTPPSEYCPSDFDECKYDWDCEGTTKKCCSNGCYRVCAEPAALGEVRDKCPAPKAHKRCHLTLRNQCSNHLDCSYDPNGLCCYDGCRRRCATLGGFISELQLNQTRPGKCPRLLQPEFCVADYDECENDADCFPGKKCCSNDCFNRCVNPSFEATVSLIIASKCPNTQPLKKCHVGLKHTCNDDVECVNGTYCCFTGCRRQCWDPDARGSAALNKTGTCPILPTPPPPCVSDVDECFMDNDCVKDRKCCSNGCYNICVAPSDPLGPGAAAVKCPAPIGYHCASLQHLCEDKTDCLSDENCCFDGCRRRCMGYKSSSITSL